jgi:hypothetical protein
VPFVYIKYKEFERIINKMPGRYKSKLVNSGPNKGKYRYSMTHYAASAETVPLKKVRAKKPKVQRKKRKPAKVGRFIYGKKDKEKFGNVKNWRRGMKASLKFVKGNKIEEY